MDIQSEGTLISQTTGQSYEIRLQNKILLVRNIYQIQFSYLCTVLLLYDIRRQELFIPDAWNTGTGNRKLLFTQISLSHVAVFHMRSVKYNRKTIRIAANAKHSLQQLLLLKMHNNIPQYFVN